MLSGVTLITHGFGSNASDGSWVREMGAAISARMEDTLGHPAFREILLSVQDDGAGGMQVDARRLHADLADKASGETLVYLDWGEFAGSFFDTATYTNALASTAEIAAAVLPRLLEPIAGITSVPLVAEPLHFIGHSRGGSLLAELTKLLGEYGIWVDQLTTLDPHPVDGVREPTGIIDFSLLPAIILNPNYGDSPVNAYSNVVFADNFWREDQQNVNLDILLQPLVAAAFGDPLADIEIDDPDGLLDFWGQPVAGAANFQLSEMRLEDGPLLTNPGYNFPLGGEHADTHLWYHGTIDTSISAHDGEQSVPTDWYGGSHPSRTTSGYNYSRIVGGTRPDAGVSELIGGEGTRAAIDWTNATWPSIVDFRLNTPSRVFQVGSLIRVSYYYQDVDSSATTTFFLDEDRNPYNGNAHQTDDRFEANTGSTLFDDGQFMRTDGIVAGNYYVSARISDSAGHARWVYAADQVTLVPSAVVDINLRGFFFNVIEEPLMQGDSFTVDLTVENTGTDPSGSFDVAFYVSRNSTIETSDFLLGTRTLPSVAGGSSPDHSVSLTLPPPGNAFWETDDRYTIGMVIDSSDVVRETDESDNSNRGELSERLDRDGLIISPAPTPPMIGELTLTPTIINENDEVTVFGSFSDPNAEDEHTVVINWLDGQTDEFTLSVGARTFSQTHRYLDDGSVIGVPVILPILVRVRDDDGQDEREIDIELRNVPPEIVKNFYEIDEGQTVSFLDSFTDPGTLDTHTVTPASQFFADDEPSGTPFDDYTVSVTVTDDDSGSDTEDIVVRVHNVAPTLFFVDEQQGEEIRSVAEGSSLVVDGFFVDPGTDEWTGTVDYGDGSGVQPLALNPDKSIRLEHAYSDGDNFYNVIVRIDDDDLGVGQLVIPVFVFNVAPTIALEGSTATREGDEYSLTLGPITDPGDDTVTTWIVHWGDGTSSTYSSGGVKTHTYADDHPSSGTASDMFAIRVDLVDEDGTFADAGTKSITVENVSPSLWIKGLRTIDEGTELVVEDIGLFNDPGFGPTENFTGYINWGDGTGEDEPNIDVDIPGSEGRLTRGTFNGSHVFVDSGRYIARLRVQDDDGGVSPEREMTVVVNNVAPDVIAIGAQTIDEGDGIDGVIATFTDPGVLDTQAATIDWGDGSPIETGSIDQLMGTVSGSHFYSDNGAYIVSVRVEDNDGDSNTATFEVVVKNVDPTLFILGNQAATVGIPLVIPDFAMVEDPGFDNPLNPGGATRETFTYSINWGDGTGPDNGDVSIDAAGGPGFSTFGSFGINHLFTSVPAGGFYGVSVTVTDDDGGSVTEQFEVEVSAPPLPIASGSADTAGIVGRPSGIILASDAAKYEAALVVEGNGANEPPVLGVVGNLTVPEGQLDIEDIASFVDFDGAEPFMYEYEIDWGDGTPHSTGDATIDDLGAPPAGSFDGMHLYADNGSFTVTVSLSDGTDTATEAFELTVENVSPNIGITGAPESSPEGTSITLGSSVIDPGNADTHEYQWSVLKDGVPYDDGQNRPTNEPTFTFTPNDGNADYRVTLAVRDDDMMAASDDPVVAEATISVTDVPPIIALAGESETFEGASYVLTLGEITDPGDDTVTQWIVDWGDGRVDTYFSGGMKTHTYLDDVPSGTAFDVYTIIVDLVDEDGTHATAGMKQITVHNQSPTVTIQDAPVSSPEGTEITLSTAVTDDGIEDTLGSYEWSVRKNGVPFDDGSGNPKDQATFSFTPNNEGDYDVSVTVADDDTGQGTAAVPIEVINVPPRDLVLDPVAVIFEGDEAILRGTFSDPGVLDTHTVTVDWGDGTAPDTQPVAGPEFMLTHVYVDDNPTGTPEDDYAIGVTLTDDALGSTAASTSVTVKNAAPTLENLAITTPIGEGEVATLNGDIVDQGVPDTFTLTVDWGDGIQEQFQYGANDRSFTETHRYADNLPGDVSYQVSLVVEDDDIGMGNAILPAQVFNRPPTAVDDLYEFDGIGTLEIDSTNGVLANDSDPGMDELSVIEWGTPSEGTLVQTNSDGSFQYEAPADFSGTVTFDYLPADDDGTAAVAPGIVTIEVGLNASVSGYVYSVNTDSRFQPAELALPGVTVELEAIDGRSVVEINTITDDIGYYHFDGLRSGTYRVTEQQPAAVFPGGPDELQVTVLPNQASEGNNFEEGWLQPQHISLRSLLASTPANDTEQLRQQLARAEEAAGNVDKAAEIRLGEAVQVARRGQAVEFVGTSFDDTFRFVPLDPAHGGQHAVTVNNRTYVFNPAEVKRFTLLGGDGHDHVEVFDTPGDDRLEGRFNVTELLGDDFEADFIDFEWLKATSSRGGNDQLLAETTIDYVLETVGDWNV
jgi:hypothetical protein